MTREERKLLGYFSRLDDVDQELILEILRKSIRVNRTIWSTYCFNLIKRLDDAERRESNTLDLFAESDLQINQTGKQDLHKVRQPVDKKGKNG